jgi:hypothetical protein
MISIHRLTDQGNSTSNLFGAEHATQYPANHAGRFSFLFLYPLTIEQKISLELRTRAKNQAKRLQINRTIFSTI